MPAEHLISDATDGQPAILPNDAPPTGDEAPVALRLTSRPDPAEPESEPEPEPEPESEPGPGPGPDEAAQSGTAEAAPADDHGQGEVEPRPPDPSPERAAAQTPQPRRAPTELRRRPEPLPDVDDLMRRMLNLNGAVLTGAISEKTAAFVQRNLKAALDVQLKRASSGSETAGSEVFLDVVRRDPTLFPLLQDHLSDDQLEQLLREAAQEQDDEPV